VTLFPELANLSAMHAAVVSAIRPVSPATGAAEDHSPCAPASGRGDSFPSAPDTAGTPRGAAFSTGDDV
jgi:hypothetical protein